MPGPTVGVVVADTPNQLEQELSIETPWGVGERSQKKYLTHQ